MSGLATSPLPRPDGPLGSASSSHRLALPLLIAAGAAGPLALGAILAARTSSLAPLGGLPLAIIAVTAVTTPALYIATAATGWAPPARQMLVAVARALGAMGLGLLGFVAPLVFLVTTSTSTSTGVALVSCGVAAGALIGLSALRRQLFDGQPESLQRDGIFVVWAAVALVIAARLYTDLAIGGGS